MTVKEALEGNITVLQSLRVPIGEQEIYQTISNTINNLRACVDAIAKCEAEAQEQAT